MRLPWPPILFLACLGAGLLGERLLSGRLAPQAGTLLGGIGLLLAAAGILFTGLAIRTMLRAGTEIRPNRPAGHLLRAGPFAFSRNPIYEGEVLLLAGLAALFASPALALAGLAFLIGINAVIRLEERHLAARFGDEYRDYRARTPRLAIAWLFFRPR
jgi:protein-S-isoprenylcysteine O-methyltransferase Ste14